MSRRFLSLLHANGAKSSQPPRLWLRGRFNHWLGGCLLLAGCGSIPDPSRLSGIRQLLQEAELGDAEHCAPRELALARAHLEFASIELDQGDVGRAQEHLVDSELNAEAARRAGAGPCHSLDLRDAHAMPEAGSSGDRDHDGVADYVDLCPDQAEDLDGYVDRDGCPDADNDGDLVADGDDQCPDASEDRDGFRDEDGCPDLDNDEDGVPDIRDACPLAAGDDVGASGAGELPPQSKAAGCPTDYSGLTVTAKRLVLSPSLSFDRQAETLSSQDRAKLSTVVQALKDRSGLVISVQVHTDSRGDDDKNLALSRRQAAAVVAHLAAQGIESSRLRAVGHGETRPLESNRTSQGRAINRRVEFSIEMQKL